MVSTRTVAVAAAAVLALVGIGLFGFASPADTDPGVDTPPVLVLDSSVPERVRPNETFGVSVSVTGETDAVGDRSIGLYANATGDGRPVRLDEQDVRVSGDRTTEIEFTVAGARLSPGEYRMAISASNRTVGLDTVTVMRPPALTIGAADTDLRTARDRPVNATAVVTNTGGYTAPAPVELAVDLNDDGSFTPGETVADAAPSLGAGRSDRVRFELVPASLGLDPGNYTYRIATGVDSHTGTLTVLDPPSFELTRRGAPESVVRGSTATVGALVRNTGDVAGSETVALSGPDGRTQRLDVSLASGETASVSFAVPTDGRKRGTHTYTVSTDDDELGVPVRVRDARFDVSELRGNETVAPGDPLVFAANVTNTGDATGTATVAYRIDLDGDDHPETVDITRRVTLAPGETRRVQFRLPSLEDADNPRPVEKLSTGAYIYGIYTSDSNETSLLAVRTADSGPGPLSRDEISQGKYGLFYRVLSNETRMRVREIEARQPFADGLGVRQVLTREQLARQEYGIDVDPGEPFRFTSIDVEVQQRIEAEFDAQFTRETGDRIESWDELARSRYGTPFEDLDESRQLMIRAAYREQFDS